MAYTDMFGNWFVTEGDWNCLMGIERLLLCRDLNEGAKNRQLDVGEVEPKSSYAEIEAVQKAIDEYDAGKKKK